jgi:ribosomal protein S12 methylthiotransferase accessory factor YcaO
MSDEANVPTGYWAGTHRLIAPEETLEKVQRFLPVMGITRVADITGLDTIGIPVIAVCRPNSRSVVVSLGKGLDVMAARASGVMESIEAFMAERIVRPLIIGSVNDLKFSHPLVDVDLIPRTADSIYHPDFAHGVHAPGADRDWVLHRDLKRARVRQPPARGDQPRHLRDGRARRGHPACPADAGGPGAAPGRSSDRG